MVGTGVLLLSICTCLLRYRSVHFQSDMKAHRIVLHIFDNKSTHYYFVNQLYNLHNFKMCETTSYNLKEP